MAEFDALFKIILLFFADKTGGLASLFSFSHFLGLGKKFLIIHRFLFTLSEIYIFCF